MAPASELRTSMSMLDKKTLLGIALGVGGTLAAPFALALFGSLARPMVKTVLKQSLLGTEKLRERLALAAEALDDLVAEVRSEVEQELVKKGPRRAGAERDGAPSDERVANGVRPSGASS